MFVVTCFSYIKDKIPRAFCILLDNINLKQEEEKARSV